MEPLDCKEVSYTIVDEDTNSSLIKLDLPKISDDDFPKISVVTPTRNRSHFFGLIMRNWKSIEYPKHKMELIILDDSDVEPDPSILSRDSRIRYFHCSEKMTIGRKRNELCKLAQHPYIVHLDDDDWYVAESVACRMRILLDFEKKIGRPACFGCTKVVCLDLLSNQMFTAYDESIDGSPATVSESTLAYSRKYWEEQGWDDSSTVTECLPFVKNRTQTLCTGPSSFVIVQFSHGENTIHRRVKRSNMSEANFARFESNLSAYDDAVFNQVRASVISRIPCYRDSLEFIKKNYQNSPATIRKNLQSLDKSVRKTHLTIDFIQERLVSKSTTSGKDVVYYCGPGKYFNFTSKWGPEDKLGGSEEGVVNLSQDLAKRGFSVTVYCCLRGEKRKHKGVQYLPYYEWIPKDKQDVTIVWRDPSNCNKSINSRKVLLDLHDAVYPYWIKIPQTVEVMVKSEFHRNMYSGIRNLKNRFHVIPNGIQVLDNSREKTRNLMVCTSSSDRCLTGLLNALPLIRKEVPDAEIHWAYGFSLGVSMGMEDDPSTKDWVVAAKKRIEETEGFKDLGRLDERKVTDLYERGDLFVYPTLFPEIDCISLTKAMSAGCHPVVTNAGAMREKMGSSGPAVEKMTSDTPDYSAHEGPVFESFVREVVAALKSERVRDYDITRYKREIVVEKWVELLKL